MNPFYLTSPFALNVQTSLDDYLTHNDTPVVSPLVFWGTSMQVASRLKQRKEDMLGHLEESFWSCYATFQSHTRPLIIKLK